MLEEGKASWPSAVEEDDENTFDVIMDGEKLVDMLPDIEPIAGMFDMLDMDDMDDI